jgi:radical SAM superfamily enzyme YgiQ (UPF0313 family)
MKKFSIGSVQINNGFSGQYYLPYSIGTLEAYFLKFSKNAKRYNFATTIYKRLVLNECLHKLCKDDVILFSVYVWNKNISIEIAKELKKIDKNKFIVFGGPSAPDNAEKFLRKHDFIDCIVHQEGERTITSVLDSYPNEDWRLVPGISSINLKGEFITQRCLPKMRDITVLPSPYLEGTFDRLMKENPNERWLASWETNRGCPFSCTYCDWGSATASKVSRMDMDKLGKELLWFAKNKVEFIYVCDANFGMLPRDMEISKMAIEMKKKYGYPHVLSVQTTKNARERSYDIQKLLYEGGMHKSVNMAMQSMNLTALKEIKRDNISLNDYKILQKRFISDGIPTYSDLIIGLPGDTFESFKSSVNELISIGQHYRVQFNNLSILPNAEMAKEDYIKKNEILISEIPIVNMHGSLEDEPEDGIHESQEMVISTKDMPKDDWIKTRSFATLAEFYYFNKMLQIPILLINKLTKLKFSDIFQHLYSVRDETNFPIITKINHLFEKHSLGISTGDNTEFIFSKKWHNIYWPPGEFAMLKLFENRELDKFYKEANFILNSYVNKSYLSEYIDQAVNYNYLSLKKPFLKKNITINLDYDIPSDYKKSLLDEEINLEKRICKYEIQIESEKTRDFLQWAQEVIWYGHRQGDYLYKTLPEQKIKINSN